MDLAWCFLFLQKPYKLTRYQKCAFPRKETCKRFIKQDAVVYNRLSVTFALYKSTIKMRRTIKPNVSSEAQKQF